MCESDPAAIRACPGTKNQHFIAAGSRSYDFFNRLPGQQRL